ncbi:MAG TPA: ABC transporter ATP-binding protein [Vicinamibacteria bacterium]|jgi:ABC-type polysaccharide/polyol phosphate transport system ATPase subunit
MATAIQVSDLTKVYQRYSHRKQFRTLKSALLRGNLLQELKPDERFPALEGVTFNVRQGSTFAVIGRNGSGKSTLLKVIAGISKPSAGTVRVNGRISALIELGAGFHPEITGRENVFINGIMLGLTRKEIADRYEEIVAFAELEEFIEAPVKTYSSGMYMRLGFAVAIHVNPDVLLIDEVLAVGDEAFVHKCLDKISEFRRRGKTILLVTHSLGMVEKMADEALWIDRSRVQMRGDPKKVVDAYLAQVTQHEEDALAAEEAKVAAEFEEPSAREEENGSAVEPTSAFARERGRWGSREVEIQEVSFLDSSGSAKHVFATGEPVTVRLKVTTTGAIEDFVFGVAIFNADGVCCYGTNTHLEEFTPVRFSGTGEVRFVVPELQLVEGTYFLDVAAHQRDGYPFDYHRALHQFRIQSKVKDVGIYRPRHRWEFSGDVRLEPPGTS